MYGVAAGGNHVTDVITSPPSMTCYNITLLTSIDLDTVLKPLGRCVHYIIELN